MAHGSLITSKFEIDENKRLQKKDPVVSGEFECNGSYYLTPEYKKHYRRSLADPEGFWADVAQKVVWTKPWDKVMDDSDPISVKWWSGGELSVCYNAVDRHVENGRGDDVALIHDSPLTKTSRKITYKAILYQVSRIAGKLTSLGVTRGSRVVIYMPLVPEAIFAMLACNRIGAVHSVVFGGFAAGELKTRIEHAQPVVVIGASCGLEPTRVVKYKVILDEAIEKSTHKPKHCIIFQRTDVLVSSLIKGRDVSWEEALQADPVPCVSLEANEPLYILYTSGTTAAPKGIQRPCGHAATLCWSMEAVYGAKSKDVWWAASDLGWVVGHSYICYAPLLAGITSVMYEGKPDRTPNAGQYFRVLEQYGVNIFFTVPTAFRLLRQVDPYAMFAKKYSFKSLRNVIVGGEHCDKDSKDWAERTLGVPVTNHWWQTESGSPVVCACLGYGLKGVIPKQSVGFPVPGFDIRALNDDGTECNPLEVGRLVLKLPLPPGFVSTMWQAHDRFKETYFDIFPGYYDTQDAGYISSEGAVWIVARVDDVINIAGHRISSSSIEDVILRHPRVADAVVFGAPDATKGDVPICVYVIGKSNNNEELSETAITKELVAKVREEIGPVAAFREAVAIPAIPRTRSGKALRGAISKLARSELVKLPATVENPDVFPAIKAALQKIGFAINAPDPIVSH